MPYNPMPDDYRERIKIARDKLGTTQAGDEYELRVLRQEVRKLEDHIEGLEAHMATMQRLLELRDEGGDHA